LLTLLPFRSADGAARSQLVVNGSATGLVVPGCCLEAQLAVGDRRLMFITNDIPFEERLEVCLVDAMPALVDRLALSWPYATGRFADLTVRSAREVAFSFFDEKTWVIEVLPVPRLYPSFLGDPRGVWRPLGLRRCLMIRTEPRYINTRRKPL